MCFRVLFPYVPILGRNLSKPVPSCESRLGGVEPKFDKQIVITSHYHSLAVFVVGTAPKKSSILEFYFRNQNNIKAISRSNKLYQFSVYIYIPPLAGACQRDQRMCQKHGGNRGCRSICRPESGGGKGFMNNVFVWVQLRQFLR